VIGRFDRPIDNRRRRPCRTLRQFPRHRLPPFAALARHRVRQAHGAL